MTGELALGLDRPHTYPPGREQAGAIGNQTSPGGANFETQGDATAMSETSKETGKMFRFGCGGLLGIALVVIHGLFLADDVDLLGFGGAAAVAAVTCGLLAMKFGDRFLLGLFRWL